MKKKILLSIALVLMLLVISFCIDFSLYKPTKINAFIASKIYKTPANATFTDQNFYNCVIDNYNSEKETNLSYTTALSDEQLSSIERLSCSYKEIANAEGLEKLINLNYLDLSYNNIELVDVSENISLKQLYVAGNSLTAIDITNNSDLMDLDIRFNDFTSLNLVGDSLKYLRISNNKITHIDITALVNLENLYSTTNEIEDIDLTKNKKLIYIDLSYNKLSEINVGQNTGLKTLNVKGNNLTNLDLSENTELSTADLASNQLSTLNINNNKKLETLWVSDNNLNNLDLSENTELSTVNLSSNRLSTLNTNNNKKLETLWVSGNNLTNLDLSENTELSTVNLSSNQLTELVISNKDELKQLIVCNNQLTNLDVSNDSKLKIIEAYNNNISTFGFLNTTALEELYIYNNSLADLDLSNNSSLKILTANDNQLSSLKVNDGLEYLYVNNNNIESIDLSKNINLETLSISANNLNSINLTNNVNLKALDLSFNALLDVDLRENILLESLEVSNVDAKYNKIQTVFLYQGDDFEAPQSRVSILLPNNENFSTEVEYYDAHYNPCSDIDTSQIGRYQIRIIDRHNFKGNLIYKTSHNSYSTVSKYGWSDYRIDVYVQNLQVYRGTVLADIQNKVIYTWEDDDITLNALFPTSNVTVDSIENNKYIIKYKDDIVDTFDLIRINNKYKFNSNAGLVLYVGVDELDLDNINVGQGSKEIINDKLVLKYTGDLSEQSISIAKVRSEKYDLSKKTIVIKDNNNISHFLTNINTINCNARVFKNNQYTDHGDFENNDVLIIRTNGGALLDEYKLVKISSDKYNLDDDYIYTGTEEFDLSKINIINGSKNVEDNQLKISYDDEILETKDIYSINFGEIKTFKDKVVILEDMSYESFTNNITPTGVSYKIYNGEVEVTEGTITEGMKVKVYIDEDLVDEYEVTNEYLEIDESLSIDEDSGVIEDLVIGQTIEEILRNFETSGNKKILNGEEEVTEGVIGTGYKVVIELSHETIEYTVSVKGDVTGTGQITMADVMKTATHMLDGNVIEGDCYLKAADVTGDGNIMMSDVMKIASYVLEGGSL